MGQQLLAIRYRSQYLREIGIVRWQRRVSRTSPVRADGDGIELEALADKVRQCQACGLHTHRQNTVFGHGSIDADWLFVGEAPGSEEDKQGLPFVGRAGQLLDSILFSIGLARDEVYIANVLKCRPPRNRDPMGEEVIQCEPYLHKQIDRIRPEIIIAMGRFAAQALLKSTASIAELRGQRHEYSKFRIPLVVTYHPAYLLRSPLEKQKVWKDLQFAQVLLHGSESERST